MKMNLSNRERLFAAGSIILAAAWILYAAAISPAVERIGTLKRVIPQKNLELRQLSAKSDQYLELKNKIDSLRKTASFDGTEFELLPFVEEITKTCKFTEKIAAIKQNINKLDDAYSEIVVELRLQSITLTELVTFLSKITSSEHLLQIKSMYTKKSPGRSDLLDTVLYISTLKQYKNPKI
ncbi:MAG: hypothetical protein E4H40_05130 [Candidatus Brocadiia bacterium]|nr:MAG: hypothetical protein E4H40_05130 [Candidatus Brocadiia bacterium]